MSTLELGPLEANVNCQMYSFDRPSHILWQSVIATLQERGWATADIKRFLQSKEPRWSMDSELGEAIAALGRMYASQVTK